jgi:hypothetical protein
LTLAFCAVFFSTILRGQNLSPKELEKIQQTSDFATITAFLVEKGFKKGPDRSDEAAGTVGRWYFQPFTDHDDQIISYLIKTVDSSQKAKTVFTLYNQFHYKEFLSNLTDARYKFKGTRFRDGHTYYVFKNKRYSFDTIEKSTPGKTRFAEVLLQHN